MWEALQAECKKCTHQALTSSSTTREDLWRQRFGHINFNDLLLLQKRRMVNGLPDLKHIHVDCEACALGKMHIDDFHVNVNRKQRDTRVSPH